MSETQEKIIAFLNKTNVKYKKKYKDDIIYIGDQIGDYLPLPTGFPTVDWINSGIGGFPRGGMTLIHGEESAGKSTFVLESIYHNQQTDPNFQCYYNDVENSLTKHFLKFKKLDSSRMVISPLNTEDSLNTIEDAIIANLFDMIVIDSLAKLESDKILAKDQGEKVQRNRRAVMITEFFRRIPFVLRNSKTALVCINQEIINQDDAFGAPKMVIPCGQQQKHSANLRLQLKRKSAIKNPDKTKHIGYLLTVASLKNKIANKEKALTNLTYLFDRGFIKDFSILDYLKMINIIHETSTNKVYEFKDKTFYPNTFKLSELKEITEFIKTTKNIDLLKIVPDENTNYQKIQFDDDIKIKDEI